MDTYNILKKICLNRKSLRNFSDKEISADDIKKIFDIAYTSPYASGKNKWEIEVVTDKLLIKQIAELVKAKALELKNEIDEEFKESFFQYSKNFYFFEKAPVILVPTFRPVSVFSMMSKKYENKSVQQWERDNYTKSISCVAMLILLAAESIGIGACYMTGPLIAQNEIVNLISSKKGREIGAFIPIAYKNNK